MPTEEEQKRFLTLCKDGDLQSIQELLAKDPLLIKSKHHDTGKQISNVYTKIFYLLWGLSIMTIRNKKQYKIRSFMIRNEVKDNY